MKLFYVSNATIPSNTANSIHVMKMCHALAKLGLDVSLIVRSVRLDKDIFAYYGVANIFKIVQVQTFQLKGLNNILFAIQTILYLKKQKKDIVYSRDLWFSYLYSKLNGTVSYEMHASQWEKGWWTSRMVATVFKRCKYIVVITNTLFKASENFFGGKMDNLVVQHDASDDYFELNTKANGINERKIVVGYMGSFKEGKGIKMLASLSNFLDPNHYVLQIVGGSREEILMWSNSFNSASTEFVERLPPAEAGRFINNFDICLMPNEKIIKTGAQSVNIAPYTSPLKLFEYMSCGKAIIMSDFINLREVCNNEEALFVDSGNVNEWLAAIDLFGKDETIRKEYGSRARKTYSEKYSWDVRAKEIFKLLVK